MAQNMMAATYSKLGRSIRYIYSALFVASVLTPVMAAAETSPWQGNYVGIFMGGGFGSNQVSTNAGTAAGTYFANFTNPTADINAVNNSGSYTDHPSSALMGVQAGQDWAYNHMVYGVVMDFTSLPLSSSQSSSGSYPDGLGQYSESASMKVNWLFTLRGRVGYATKIHDLPSLFYLTTGPALTQVDMSNSFSDTSALQGVGGTSTSSYQLGWTVGAGLELLTFNHISIDLEYLYVQMASASAVSTIYNSASSFGTSSGSNPFTTNGKLRASLLKLGLNYRF